MRQDTEGLIETAYRQALALFEKEAEEGLRSPREEIAVYRRRRRDYLSLLRLEQVPDEARELAMRLAETHDLQLDREQHDQFGKDVTAMLVRLYDAFISYAGDNNHGSR